jgi:hypothetical protein
MEGGRRAADDATAAMRTRRDDGRNGIRGRIRFRVRFRVRIRYRIRARIRIRFRSRVRFRSSASPRVFR